MTNITGIAGGIIASHGQKIAAEQSAQIQEANAKAAEQDARNARLSAAIDAEYIQEDGAAAAAHGRAVAASQGASTSDGSPMIALMDMAGKNRRAVFRRQYQGEVEAAKFLTEAAWFKQKASFARTIGVYNVLATALSGPAQGYDMSSRGTTRSEPTTHQGYGTDFSSSSDSAQNEGAGAGSGGGNDWSW